MSNARLALVGLAAILVALSIVATAAFADFTSSGKKTTGEAQNVEVTLTAGGATVKCQAYNGSSKVTWQLLNEGKEATKGPDLRLKSEKWGECTGESSEIKQTKAELATCELEVKEPGEESEVTATLISECSAKFASCTVKLAPKENEKLKSATLYASGAEDENLGVESEFLEVATSLSGSCPGVKATKAATLHGFVLATQVRRAGVPEFSISVVPGNPSRLAPGESTTIRIRREAGATAAPGGESEIQIPLGTFKLQEPRWSECATKPYALLAECTFKDTYKTGVGSASHFLVIAGTNGPPNAVQLIEGVP